MPSIITGPSFYYFFFFSSWFVTASLQVDLTSTLSPLSMWLVEKVLPMQCSQSKKNGNGNKKTSEHAAWSSRKMSLSVTLSVWSYIRIRINIFLWYKRMQLSSSRITVQLNPQSCEAAATNASLLTSLCGDQRNRGANKTFCPLTFRSYGNKVVTPKPGVTVVYWTLALMSCSSASDNWSQNVFVILFRL